MTRKDFNIGPCTRPGTLLRNLAKDISEYLCQQARGDCFFTADPAPYNILANGETNNYTALAPVNGPAAISNWKFNGRQTNVCLDHGFNDDPDQLSRRGLSLIIDPFVDAFIAANAGIGSSIPQIQTGATVIVLSDYGAIDDPGVGIKNFAGCDWGLEETQKLLEGDVKDPTTRSLFDCIFGNAWKNNSVLIENCIRQRNVLIWNFMPFLRAGAQSANDAALPDPTCGGWLQSCINFLGQFIEAAGATKVVFCVNKRRMLPFPGNGSKPLLWPVWNARMPRLNPGKLRHYLNKGGVFVLNHPFAWFNVNHCPDLNNIIDLVL